MARDELGLPLTPLSRGAKPSADGAAKAAKIVARVDEEEVTFILPFFAEFVYETYDTAFNVLRERRESDEAHRADETDETTTTRGR